MKELKIVDLKVMVIGINQCWGMADTIEEALRHAQSPKRYVAHVVHPDSDVCGVTGQIISPKGFEPKLIARVGFTGIFVGGKR